MQSQLGAELEQATQRQREAEDECAHTRADLRHATQRLQDAEQQCAARLAQCQRAAALDRARAEELELQLEVGGAGVVEGLRAPLYVHA